MASLLEPAKKGFPRELRPPFHPVFLLASHQNRPKRGSPKTRQTQPTTYNLGSCQKVFSLLCLFGKPPVHFHVWNAAFGSRPLQEARLRPQLSCLFVQTFTTRAGYKKKGFSKTNPPKERDSSLSRKSLDRPRVINHNSVKKSIASGALFGRKKEQKTSKPTKSNEEQLKDKPPSHIKPGLWEMESTSVIQQKPPEKKDRD